MKLIKQKIILDTLILLTTIGNITANGCGYEIGWECEELIYQTAQTLQRVTQLNNLLKPNCFIPVVSGWFY